MYLNKLCVDFNLWTSFFLSYSKIRYWLIFSDFQSLIWDSKTLPIDKWTLPFSCFIIVAFMLCFSDGWCLTRYIPETSSKKRIRAHAPWHTPSRSVKLIYIELVWTEQMWSLTNFDWRTIRKKARSCCLSPSHQTAYGFHCFNEHCTSYRRIKIKWADLKFYAFGETFVTRCAPNGPHVTKKSALFYTGLCLFSSDDLYRTHASEQDNLKKM